MAKIIESGFADSVEENFRGYRRRLIAKYALRVLCCAALLTAPLLVMYLLGPFSAAAAVLWGLGLIVAALVLAFSFRGINLRGLGGLRSGYKGEQRGIRVLARLPRTFLVLPDVRLRHEGQVQSDAMLIGPSGVFCFEIKNHGGHATVTSKKSPVKLIRRSGSREHRDQMDNPILQSERAAAAARSVLGDMKLPKNAVCGAVLFSGRHTTLDNRTSYPVFCYRKRSELYAYIKERPADMLTQDQVFEAARRIRSRDPRLGR